jgi:hypothetical protein
VTRVLATRELNRALLARQLLLKRSPLSVPKALEQIAGIQNQYAPSASIRLWSCLRKFALGDLDRLLTQRKVVQGTLMRSTIHLVSARDWWGFAEGIGPSRQDWWQSTWGKEFPRQDMDTVAAKLARELAGRPWLRKELDALLRAHGSSIWSGVWVPLIRVPPSGTWTRRRADIFQLAAEWIGASDTDERRGLEHLLRRYLGGFGPARLAEAADWAGVAVAKMKAASEGLTLRTFGDEQGRELVDLPGAPLPLAETPAPVRFLPTWDAVLLVHARRTQILPETYRPMVFSTKTPHSVGTFLVDGSVAGIWRVERTGDRATLFYTPFERLASDAERELRDEAAALVRFIEPSAASFALTRMR